MKNFILYNSHFIIHKSIIHTSLFIILFLGFFFVLPASAQATDKYWIGGTGNWSDTTHWSLTSGGSSGASAPSASDNCYFDANSFNGASQTVTIDTSATCLDMVWTGATNTPTLAGSSTLTISGSITLIVAMSWTHTGGITFNATTTGKTVTLAGLSINDSLNFNGSGGGWTLQDALNLTTTGGRGVVTATNGTLDWGSFTHNIFGFADAVGTKQVNFNSSTLNLNGTGTNQNVFSTVNSNTTISANTATLVHSSTLTTNSEIIRSIYNMNGMSMTLSGAGSTSFTSSGSTWNNLTATGTASILSSVAVTFTGTVSITGTSISSRIRFASSTRGTSVTMSAATWTLSNVDFEDIAASGAGTFSAAADVGDLGGNSGNFAGRTAATYYWVSGTGSYSNTAKWSLSSGGASASTIPLPQDTANFDANSFTAGSQTVTLDVIRIGSIDMTGATNTPTIAFNSVNVISYGALTLISGMSVTKGTTLTMEGRGTNNYDPQNINPAISQRFDTITGTINQRSTISSNSWFLDSGTYNTNNNSITTTNFQSSNSNTRTLNLGSSVITNSGASGTTFTTTTGLTFNAGTSVIKFTNAGATQFDGGSLTWYDVQLNTTGGSNTVTVIGSNTLHSLTASSTTRTITFTAGTTQTITSRNGFISGSSGAVQTLQSSSSGSAWYLNSSTGDQQSSDYLSIQDSVALQAKTWYAGANSTNVSGNTNWVFTTPGYSVNAPTAYWKLDDATGTTAKSSGSISNSGTLSGSTLPTWQTEDMCVSGKCLYFDGSTSYVRPANTNTAISTGTTWTMQGWFKTTTTVGGVIYSEGNSGSGANFAYIRILSTGRVDFNANDGSTTITIPTTDTSTYNDGKWHMMTTTRSGSTIAIYVDGINRTANGTYTINAPTINILTLGALGRNTVSSSFPGFLDEIKTYDYARTASQIAADFNARSTIEGASFEADGALNNNPNALNNNLVGYWKMNETSWNGTSGEVVDSSGNSNNGTGNGGITTAAGKFGNGGSYDGSNDYISVADASTLRLSTGAYSSFAWINTSSPSTIQSVIRKGSLTYVLALVSSGKVFCQVGSTSINTGTAVTANTWAHIGCTYDGTTLTSWLNGVSQGSTTVSPAADIGSSVFLGSQDGTSQFFVGKMDEARLYNRFLTPNQVSQLYNFAPGPISYWNFEEGSGTTINDRSGFANAGTFNGSGTTRFKNGKYGFSGNFNGSDDDVSTTNVDLISNQGTISAWVNIAAYPVTGEQFIHQIASENTAGNDTDFKLQLGDSTDAGKDNITIDHRLNGTDTSSISTTNLSLNTWYHVSGTWDGSTLRLYINGVLEDSDSASGVLSTSETGAYKIGELAESAIRNWEGQMDEVKIYNYARSASQVVEDMNGGHPTPGGSITAQSSNFGMSGSPVGYWKFNEGQGTTANNSGSVGSTINGTLTNMASPATSTSGWTQSGKFGKSLAFDGTDDYVSIPDNASLNITGNLSVSAWVYLNNTVNRRVLSKGSDSSANYGFQSSCNGDGKMCFNVNNGGTLKQVISQNAATTGVWTHWVGVYDGTNISLYMNGMLQNQTAVTGVLTTNSGIFTIGTQTNLGGFINASIDDVKIYNFALTADQVKQDMNRGANEVLGAAGDNSSYEKQAANQEYCVPGDSTACTAPVGEWKFEEGSGSSANDTSGNAHTGTWNGSGITHYKPGKPGKAGNFDGSTDYVTHDLTLSKSSGTIEHWIKANQVRAMVGYYESDGTSGSYNGFGNPTAVEEIHTGIGVNDWRFIYQDGDQASQSVTLSGGTAVANQWTHIAATWNRSGSAYLYVNGVQVATAVMSTITWESRTPTVKQFGRTGDGTASRMWDGQIDQVRVYDYARTPAQIAWDYSKGAPVAMYKLDECTGSTLNDSSGNSYTGTLTIGSSGTQTSAGTCVAVDTATAWYNGRTGKFNSSLNFDGTDDFITTSAFSPLATAALTTTKLSWGGWFYPTSSVASKTLMEKATEFQLTTNSSSQPLCGVYYSAAFHNSTAPSETLTLNSWNHVMCVYDGTNINTYLNGVLIKQSSETNSVTAASSILYTAESSSAGSRYSGQIDSERIYNYALTSSQVRAVMDQDAAVRFGPLTGAP